MLQPLRRPDRPGDPRTAAPWPPLALLLSLTFLTFPIALASPNVPARGPDTRRDANQHDRLLDALRDATAQREVNGNRVPDTLLPAGFVWMQGGSDASDRRAAEAFADNSPTHDDSPGDLDLDSALAEGLRTLPEPPLGPRQPARHARPAPSTQEAIPSER